MAKILRPCYTCKHWYEICEDLVGYCECPASAYYTGSPQHPEKGCAEWADRAVPGMGTKEDNHGNP